MTEIKNASKVHMRGGTRTYLDSIQSEVELVLEDLKSKVDQTVGEGMTATKFVKDYSDYVQAYKPLVKRWLADGTRNANQVIDEVSSKSLDFIRKIDRVIDVVSGKTDVSTEQLKTALVILQMAPEKFQEFLKKTGGPGGPTGPRDRPRGGPRGPERPPEHDPSQRSVAPVKTKRRTKLQKVLAGYR